jgi:hypothetical protein
VRTCLFNEDPVERGHERMVPGPGLCGNDRCP